MTELVSHVPTKIKGHIRVSLKFQFLKNVVLIHQNFSEIGTPANKVMPRGSALQRSSVCTSHLAGLGLNLGISKLKLHDFDVVEPN